MARRTSTAGAQMPRPRARASAAWGVLVLALLTAASARPTVAGESDWPWEQGLTGRRIDLDALRANPERYAGREITFACRFATQGVLYSHLEGGMRGETHANIAVWSLDEQVWTPAGAKRLLPTLYIPRRYHHGMRTLATLQRYEAVEVTGRVVSVYAGMPWIEIRFLRRMDPETHGLRAEAVTKLRLAHHVARTNPAEALPYLDQAAMIGLPAHHAAWLRAERERLQRGLRAGTDRSAPDGNRGLSAMTAAREEGGPSRSAAPRNKAKALRQPSTTRQSTPSPDASPRPTPLAEPTLGEGAAEGNARHQASPVRALSEPTAYVDPDLLAPTPAPARASGSGAGFAPSAARATHKLPSATSTVGGPTARASREPSSPSSHAAPAPDRAALPEAIHRRVLHARAVAARGDLDGAIDIYEGATRVLADTPGSAWVRREIGSIFEARYRKTGRRVDLRRALEEYEAADAVTEREDPAVAYLLARAWFQAEDPTTGLRRTHQYLDRARRGAPRASRVRVLEARVLMAEGRYPAAYDAILKAVELDGNNLAAYQVMAALYTRLDEPRLAMIALEKAAELAPRDPRVLEAYLHGAMRGGDHEVARVVALRLLELRPASCRYRLRLGQAYMNLGHLEAAFKAFRMAAGGRDAASLVARALLVELLLDREETEAACVLVSEVERIDPALARRLRERMRRRLEAARALAASAGADPADADTASADPADRDLQRWLGVEVEEVVRRDAPSTATDDAPRKMALDANGAPPPKDSRAATGRTARERDSASGAPSSGATSEALHRDAKTPDAHPSTGEALWLGPDPGGPDASSPSDQPAWLAPLLFD